MKPSSRILFLTILASFFLSGLAGLVYQVVWTRYLALFLGHTSYAVVAVLVAFMGGLALGNAWLGARVDTLRRPLMFYACLEVGIGFYAAFFPQYFELVHGGFLMVVRRLNPMGGALLALKFVFAGIAILPPTVLMGATLPALTRYVTRSLSELRSKVAALYAINSSGAVVGTLLADWWWIPSIGLEACVYVGATISLVIGLVSLVLSHQSGEGATSPAREPVAKEPVESFTPAELRLALIGIGVSGFVAMLYEVAWTRLLGLALGSSTHAYSLMLITFISGIAAGGWIIYRWKRQTNTLAAFAWAEVALAGTLFASMFFYDLIPWWFIVLARNLNRRPETYWIYEVTQGFVCFLVMFGPAVCLGMTLPLVSRVATAELSRTGRSVGRVFAVNTLGTVLGAAVTGLLFLPYFGLAQTFALGIGLNALVGVLILAWRRRPQFRLSLLVAPALVLAVAWAAGSWLNPRWQKTFTLGIWRSPNDFRTLAEYRTRAAAVELKYHRDGAGSTVAVTAHRNPDGSPLISLRINGKADASTGTDIVTQLLAGHIPSLLHPGPRDGLVVGAGSGMTAGALLRHPTMRRVDLVEISPEVVYAAGTFFAEANQNALRDPRLHVAVEDAKCFLKTTIQEYDVIVTEPSNPWMAGVAAVFSREYYQDCRSRLRSGGIIAQWLQSYETDDRTLDMVVATISSVFPNLSVWQTSTGDLLLVGSADPVSIDVEGVAVRMKAPEVAMDLKRVTIDRPYVLFSLQHLPFGDGAFLPAATTILHSDFYPQLEYAAERAFFVKEFSVKPQRLSEMFSTRPRTLLGDWLQTHPADSSDLAALAQFMEKFPMHGDQLHRSVLNRLLQQAPGERTALRAIAELAGEYAPPSAEFERLARLPGYQLEDSFREVGLLRQFAGLNLLAYRGDRSAFNLPSWTNAEFFSRLAMGLDVTNSRSHRMHVAEILWDRGADEKFLQIAEECFNPDAKFGPVNFKLDSEAAQIVLARILDTHLRRGNLTNALSWAIAARTHGYLDPGMPGQNPRLQLLARRTFAEAMGTAGVAAH
ncbi:MAG: hypothetical protein EXS36_02880 [Pedosphaera sp.]|nr:hypothetical protein [Pedosphaera sp.]